MLPTYLRDRKFYHATAVLIGTMVGVGMYGVPFAFAKAGFLVGVAWLVGLALVVALFNLMFAELTLSTQGVHQVIGYINIWLGPWGRRLATVANIVSIYGALLAYIIVIGEFLHNILSHFIAVDPQLYSIVFAAVGSLVWLLRVRTIATIELGMIMLYTAAVLLIVALGAGSIRAVNFGGGAPDFWYLPYGVLLFAFAGMSAIPIQRLLLTGREQLMRPAILSAVGFTALMYLVFATVVVGVSGEVTSPAALAGLYGALGTPIIVLGSLLGVMTISTSYIILGSALFESFHTDYRVRAPVAWILTGLPPVVFFLSGLINFIDVIGMVGAVAVGILSALLTVAYIRARRMRLRAPELKVPVPTVVVIVIALLFIAGVVVELIHR